MISQLVSGDMMRRELRGMAESHDGNVIRIAGEGQSGFSVKDDAGKIWLIATTDVHRRRIIGVTTPYGSPVPADIYIEIWLHILHEDLDVDRVEGLLAIVRDTGGFLHSLFDLPDDLELATAVHFHGAYDIRLPRHLRSTSDFVITGANITRNPDTVMIGGDADFSGCSMEALPEGSVFEGSLVLSASTTRSLPRRLSVGRWLRIGATGIEVVPPSTRLGGGLDAADSALRIIPPGFKVPGDLIVSGSDVRRLSGVSLGGSLYIERLKHFEVTGDCRLEGNVYSAAGTKVVLPKELEDRVFLKTPFGYERAVTGDWVERGAQIFP